MRIGNEVFLKNGHTYVMGILNVTPDSFSDGGKYISVNEALQHARQMVIEGADIIDIGGESTRPGHIQISDEEEIERIVPVIEAVKKHLDVPVSVDTYKSRVAKAAIDAGADMVNDIWGLKYDPDMAKVIGDAGVACCLMHNRNDMDYKDFMKDCLDDLRETIALAKAGGIKDENIVLDPGVGFAKTYEQNLIVMKHLEEFNSLGYPMLLGTSRKSMIGLTLDLPADQRVEGTIATTVMGVMAGMSFVRVHDVAANSRAIQMTEAILKVREE
ncbi:dihydropteroate synthase [Frisingicoccus sp.]|uniref:dihydropteroate synthase n=1 Tax=Frisingicoccus sp. TaxID=1918627 RepID=UPI00386949C2